MKPTFTFLLVFICLIQALSQDSTSSIIDRIKLSYEGYGFYLPSSYVYKKGISLPKSLESSRFYGKSVGDSPLFHGASAFGLRIESDIIKNYHVDALFVGEHRGISYGVFNTGNMIVYPVLRFRFVDTLRFGQQKWIVSGSGGQERNFQQGEGLYLYNLNCHAERIRLQVRPHLIFEGFHIGDLLLGIGLELDEVYQGSVIFKDLPLSKNSKKRLDVQFALTQWKGGYYANYYNYTNAEKTFFLPEIVATLHINSDTKFYAHLGYKRVQNAYQIDSAIYYTSKTMDKCAGVIGFKNHTKQEKWHFETVAEARFYGKTFNFERASKAQFYRNSRTFFSSNTTIGNNIYPLSSYDRPFSQWGVFTEYRHQNVGALTLRTKGNVQLKNRFYGYFDLDYNVIFAENEPVFQYFFATTGLNFKLRNDVDCGVGVTNKGMNMEIFYPTFYQHRRFAPTLFMKKVL